MNMVICQDITLINNLVAHIKLARLGSLLCLTENIL